MFAMKFSMEKRIKKFWIAGFFSPAINATVSSMELIHTVLVDAKNSFKNHRDEEGEDEANQSTTEMVMRKSVARRLIQDAKTAYTKPAIIKWSVWTALATCGNFQIGNYIQTLWHAIPSAQLLLVLFTDTGHEPLGYGNIKS